MTIRYNTIKYKSETKKKNAQKEERDLEKEIELLEQEINNNLLYTDYNNLHILEQKRNSFINIRRNKIEGVMLRSKCRY